MAELEPATAIKFFEDKGVKPHAFDKNGASVQLFGDHSQKFFELACGMQAMQGKSEVTTSLTHPFKGIKTKAGEEWVPRFKIICSATDPNSLFNQVIDCNAEISLFTYSNNDEDWQDVFKNYYLPKSDKSEIKILIHVRSIDEEDPNDEDKQFAEENGMYFIDADLHDEHAQQVKTLVVKLMEYINSCEIDGSF